MDAEIKSYVRQRLDYQSEGSARLHALVVKTVQTRITYVFAYSPEDAVEKFEKGMEYSYEYYPDEVQKYAAVTVVNSEGEETVISTGSSPKETNKKSTLEFEL